MPRKLHYKTLQFHGLPINIENRKGSVRHWTDRNGEAGKTKMLMSYGYVRGTLGADGDHVDVFLGPNRLSRQVFVVNQRLAHVDKRKFDEHKCMLGFDTPEAARTAYNKHFDRPGFLGSMTEMTIERFKQWLGDGKKKTKPVHKSFRVHDFSRMRELVKGGPYIGPRGGKWADPQHKIPWKSKSTKQPAKKKLSAEAIGVLQEHIEAAGGLSAGIEQLENSGFDNLHIGKEEIPVTALVAELKSWKPKPLPKSEKLVTVHHSTTREHADRLLRDGVIPQMKPWTLAARRHAAGEQAEFRPGAGVERGLYVAAPEKSEGFGQVTLELKVPAAWLTVPAEAKPSSGSDVAHALKFEHGAIVKNPIPAGAIREVEKKSLVRRTYRVRQMGWLQKGYGRA